jgi:hypothetical protein
MPSSLEGSPPRDRRPELVLALALAAALVVLRSAVYLLHEHAYFDSDQAIVGLMAKHLAEGRAFPLFFYGQDYMLGVEAWWAVPFFWCFGPTVAALRASLVVTNCVAAALLVLGLHRWGGLRPLHALAACAFFVAAPPRTAAYLVEAMGGNVEPFVYVAALWFLRHRPAWFGVVLAVGVLNREFTIYAVPVLLAADLLSGRAARREWWRAWLLALVAFLAAWEAVQALKPAADLMGPGTRGQLLRGFAGSQVGNLLARVQVDPAAVAGRVVGILTDVLPRMLGLRRSVDVVAAQGHDWLAIPAAAVGLLVVLRLATLLAWFPGRGDRLAVARGRPASAAAQSDAGRAAFAWYLLGVGVVAMLAFAITRPLASGGTMRYLLLALLVPVGLVAALLAIEPRGAVRAAALAACVAWAGVACADNVSQLARYRVDPPANEMRQLADRLLARQVVVAEAPYWRAYRLTFLTGERVKVASTDLVRITEYQDLAASHRASLVAIRETSCAGGERVASWYLCDGGS